MVSPEAPQQHFGLPFIVCWEGAVVQVEGGGRSAFVGCTINSYYYYNIIVENGRN